LGIPVAFSEDLVMGVQIFLGVFAGSAMHLVGDIIAGRRPGGGPWPIKPFVPFSQREVGYGWFKSSDKRMNNGFGVLGVLALTLYLVSPSLGI